MHIPAVDSARRHFEQRVEFTDFVRAAALIMTTKDLCEAAGMAEALGMSERVQTALNKAVSAGSTGNTGVTTFGSLVTAFLEQVRAVGAFDRVAAAALNLPLEPGNVLIDVSSITASAPGEGVAKSLSAVSLNAEALSRTKSIAQIVMTRELIDGLGDVGIRTLGRELTRAVAVGSDTAFLNALAGSNSFEASGSSSITDILDNLEELLHNIRLGVGSAPFFIVSQATAKALAAKLTSIGISTMGAGGGSVLGVETIVSDGQVSDSITAVDARGLAIAQSEIELRSSEQASIEMTATPLGNPITPTASSSTLVSMWQTDSRCLLAERSLAVVVLRPDATASLTGLTWSASGGSPAPAF